MKLAERWETVSDWLNTDIKVRRIDIVLLLLGISIAVYYYVFYGWQAAVIGVAMYLMGVMIALWML